MDRAQETMRRQANNIAALQQWRDTEIEVRKRAAETFRRETSPSEWKWRWILIIGGSMAVGAWILTQLQAVL